MRISDWSSDVCASDLAMAKRALVPPMSTATISIYSRDAFLEKSGAPRGDGRQIPAFVPFRVADLAFLRLHRAKKGAWQRTRRTAARRGGEECVSTGSFRVSADHRKKKNNNDNN